MYHDVDGVEGTQSCLMVVSTRLSWDAARTNCPTLATGAHLLTVTQVLKLLELGYSDVHIS